MAPPVYRLHALCSPSSAKRWMTCAGSVAMEDGEPNTDSKASADGTLTHDLSAKWLVNGSAPPELVADTDRHERAALYVSWVQSREMWHRKRGATNVETFIEVALPLEGVTGERNAKGTSDALLVAEYIDHSEIDVIDLKDGYNEVASDDPQLRIYALAALQKYGLMHNFTTVHCTVVQPRVRLEPETVSFGLDDLYAFSDVVKERANLALHLVDSGRAAAVDHLQVSEEGCRYCKAQHRCPAMVKQIHETVYGEASDIASEEPLEAIDELNFVGSKVDFEALLPTFMARIPQIEAWCKYVRGKVEQLLVAGAPVEGYKLVVGRAGARKWGNEDAALKICLGNNLPRALFQTEPEMLTPSAIEKKVKKTHPDVWQSLQGVITQEPGSPSVAPADDPRPAYAAPSFDGEDYSSEGLV